MAAETFTYTPDRLIAGDHPPITTNSEVLADAEVISKYELLATNTAGALITHPGIVVGADTIVPVTGIAMEELTGDGTATLTYYESGCFFADKLVFPASANTNALKKKLFEKSKIKVVFLDVGEV